MSNRADQSSLSFWNLRREDLICDPSLQIDGLSEQEVQLRKKTFGLNVINENRHASLWIQFLRHFLNPLVLMLLFASFMSLLTGDFVSFVLIALMVVLSVVLDFVQEVRAENGVAALRRRVAIHATVTRDRKVQMISVQDIVPGDIIHLLAGDLIPADGRLIESKDLFVNQATLTGESYPSEKHSIDLPSQTEDLSEAINSVFMGTSVISGTATFIAVNTGKSTLIGKLASGLAQTPPPTSFETGTQQFGMLIMRVAIFMLLFVLLINLLFHRPLLASFLFALALAVGLTPELLPMIMTVTLSRGAIDLAKKKAIVKHLPVMHNLGAMDVLCTDKTGTLTEAKIGLARHLDTKLNESENVFRLAWLNSHFESGMKGPLDEAILSHGSIHCETWKKIDEVPFDFSRRRVSVLIDDGQVRLLIVKGAPEEILNLCDQFENPDGQLLPMNPSTRMDFISNFESMGEDGLRVIAIAYRDTPRSHLVAEVNDETSLVFAGYVSFLDPPKADAAKAFGMLTQSGIKVKVLTGDNERVTKHVCSLIGIPSERILTGQQISVMSEESLRISVNETDLFCRVNPEQKQRIILALKSSGHTVGYLGDGINDATAIHMADVGISVEGAADVAQEAASIILLEKSLTVIHDAVIHGRRTVSNVSKYILMASSANFGNMFSMACGTLLLPFLPMTAVQILLGNLLYDIAQSALPIDRVDKEEIATPVKWNISHIKRFMFTIGPIASLFDLITFYMLIKWFGNNETLFHSGWFIESLAPQMLTIFCIRTRKRLFTSWPHPAVAFLGVGMALIIIILPYTPIGSWFGLAPMPPLFFLYLLGVTFCYFTLLEKVKSWFYKSIRNL